jgi:flagellar hook protein FlgE
MSSAFGIALSALNATSDAIDVVGNNLANLNTTGYKATQVQFSDMMAQSLGGAINPAQIGLGVGQIGTISNYTQGTISTTGVGTDVAIQGNGFFILQNSTGQTLYTRDGSFQVDSSGNLIDSNGSYVQGYLATNGVVNTGGALANLQVPIGSVMPATATGNVGLTVNLDSSTAVNGTYSAPIQVIDSLGQTHTLTVTFTKEANNSWNYDVTIPNADTVGGAGSTSVLSGPGTLTFNPDGSLNTTDTTSPAVMSITGLADGANDMTTVNLNFEDSSGTPTVTQYDQASSVSGTTQDGIETGEVSSVSIQNGGLIVAKYSNGEAVNVGQLALANISNPQTMTEVGNNDLQANATTALPAVGVADTGGRGSLVGESLEASTADMATEFTNLLTYERSYQAASRVITTADQLMQETVNLVPQT